MGKYWPFLSLFLLFSVRNLLSALNPMRHGFLYKFNQNLQAMKKSFLVTLSLIAMITISLAFTRNDPEFKNLKVLPKDITKKQLDSVMHHFTNSLNVKCGFCHIQNKTTKEWDHASDENKHKLVARDMLIMTYEINDKYFDMTGVKRDLNTPLMVTCQTCHNGQKEPETIPPEPVKAILDTIKRN